MRISSEQSAVLKARHRHSLCSIILALGYRLGRGWNRMKISHRGSFSVERLQAFDEFSRETSTFRSVLICLLLPLPVFGVIMLMELIPLQDPNLGWQINYGAWLRLLAACFFLAVGFIVQTNELLPALGLSVTNVVCIALLTSSALVLTMMGVSSVWVYPIPFGTMVAGPPFFVFLMLSSRLVVGRQRFQENPNLIHDFKRLLNVLNAQGAIAILYVIFSAIYFQLAKNQQTLFILVLPILKWAVEQGIARIATHLQEYIAGIVVFSVEIFNALYVAKCLQNSTSQVTFVVLISFDVIKMGLMLYSMHRETMELCLTMKNELGLHEFEIVSVLGVVMKSSQQPGVLSTREGESVIRVRSPMELNLSTGSADLVEVIESIQHLHSQKLQSDSQAQSLKPRSSTVYPKIAPISVIGNKNSDPPNIRINDVIKSPSTTLQLSLNATRRQKFVQRSLQVLFQCEYHALVEYIEFMIPMAYGLYVEILCYLPSADYYPETNKLSTIQRRYMVENILIYAWLEFLSFVVLHLIVKWRFKFSLVHLLAFTMKNRFAELQGRLLAAFAYVMPITLVHYGKMLQSR